MNPLFWCFFDLELGKHAGCVFCSLLTHFKLYCREVLRNVLCLYWQESGALSLSLFILLLTYCRAVHQISHKIQPLEANSANSVLHARCNS